RKLDVSDTRVNVPTYQSRCTGGAHARSATYHTARLGRSRSANCRLRAGDDPLSRIRMLPRLVVVAFLGASLIASGNALRAQPATPSVAQQSEPLRVFLDCQECDFDFFRTEITFVNFVRDRQVAQVHVLVTTQRTGSGGTEFTNAFIGLKEFQGK